MHLKMKYTTTLLLIYLCVAFISCNNNTTTQETVLITAEKLQACFPEKLGDFKRMELGSETIVNNNEVVANNYKMIQTSGLYQDPTASNRTLLVTIHDTGGHQEAIKNTAPWSMLQQNNKLEDNSYERTGTYNGYPSYEKFDEHYRSSQLSFLINKRFAVDVRGSVCFMYDLKGVLSDFNFKQLE
jgi:hypothetical protein